MSSTQIKWLILLLPTITVGIWEYIRHRFLLDYISMHTGNYFTPIIVFLITITLLRKLFTRLEQIQEELNQERSTKAALLERERIARELHDGIAQSLFLLSIKVNQLDDEQQDHKEQLQGVRKTVHEVNEYVRQAIANLRYPPTTNQLPWLQSIKNLVHDFRNETGIEINCNWHLDEKELSSKEKVELYSSVREALLNIRKHANASMVEINCASNLDGWTCTIVDNGSGFNENPFDHEDRYGLKIMRERAHEMGWELVIRREDEKTKVQISKGVMVDATVSSSSSR